MGGTEPSSTDFNWRFSSRGSDAAAAAALPSAARAVNRASVTRPPPTPLDLSYIILCATPRTSLYNNNIHNNII